MLRRKPERIQRRRHRNSLELLEPRRVLDSTVVFNEIMYNPADSGDMEFVELHNQMAVDMDISDWHFSEGISYTFPKGTVVPGGGYLVVAKDPAALGDIPGATVLGPFEGRLANGGERLELQDRSDRRMDWLEYGDDDTWPVPPDGSGASLAKRLVDTLSNDASNWTSSIVVGGTPGHSNFGDDIQPEEARNHQLIQTTDLWRYEASGTDLGREWTEANFDDTNWESGQRAELVGYWPLDGNAAAVVGADGVEKGAPVTSVDRNEADGGALEFSAEGQHVEIPGGGGLDGASAGTLSLWVKWSGEQDQDCCGTYGAVTSRQANGQFSDSIIALDDSMPGEANVVWRQSGGPAGRLITSSTVVESDQWYHIAVTFTPDGSELFINGVSEGTGNGSGMNSNPDVPLGIGGWIGDGGGFSTSAVDDVAIWNHALAPSQIAALADQSVTPVDLNTQRGPMYAGDIAAEGVELPLGPSTYYFRYEFDYRDAVDRTTLNVQSLIDDGAVFYLNGQEVARQNMPDGPISYATPAVNAIDQATLSEPFEIDTTALRRGTNVLAVEVHQSAVINDPDMLFGLNLDAQVSAVEAFQIEPKTVSINELSAQDSDSPFIELYNHGLETVDVSGLRLASGEYSQTMADDLQLAPNSYVTVQLDVADVSKLGEQVHLYDDQPGHVLSAVAWEQRGLGRLPAGTGPFLKTDGETPGAANRFQLHDEIVINEVMYNYRPDAPAEGLPASYSRTIVVPADAVWRYNESRADLPTGWQNDVHPVGGDWKSGPGLLGFERSALPEPGLNTQLADPRENRVITHYFETEVEITEEQLNQFDEFEIQHAVDDGVIIYVNGVEVTRFAMPAGEVDSTTIATSSVSNARFGTFEPIPKELLRPGSNRISAEVHQRAASSNDIVFGLRMWGLNETRPPLPGRDYQENNEEWLELYNRSDRDVNLAGWQLDDAVRYEFDDQTVIPAGGYLVVARDAADLRQKWPEVAELVVGNYTGTLSNNRDRIVLRDDIGNPADVVEYFEGGQWPRGADGRGSSLELRDPDADNSLGLAWAASDETTRSTWNTYVYEGFAEASTIGIDTQWQEFVMGLLSDGEILIDDLSVVEDPYGAAIELLQNGTFEDDTVGDQPATWRIIGNHRHSEIVTDPDDPTNQALKLVATAATEHMHNHAETTFFKDGDVVRIVNGQQYRISYRAKWLTGSSQLNTRLYFGRLPRTQALDRPTHHGTPGSLNSTFEANIGPTYELFSHSPVVPEPGESVRIQVTPSDADGIQSVDAWYSVNNGPWSRVEMTADGTDGLFAAQIPGAEAGDIVQFYVEGTDQLGQASTFPRNGRESRAMFQVEDGRASDVGLHNFRMIVRPDDADFMHSEIEVMSNDRLGATFVYNEEQVFYDAQIKLSGSQRARPFQPRMSFQAKFPADQLFRGVHSTITIDRSESTGFGQREHLYHHGMSHAGGGLPSEYNDLFHIITPRNEHTGSAEAQLARYSDIFLDEQYENGSEGQLYEYELTYVPSQTVDRNAQSRKKPNPDTVDGIPIRYQGESNEDYRWGFLNKNNRVEDNYEQLKVFTQVMELRGDEFSQQIGDVIDVDQWLRSFAFSVITGHGDNYGADNSQHNLQLYVRPSDNRVLFFPHDLDAFFDARRNNLTNHGDLRKIIDVPEWEHMYLGHVLDMIDTTFNRDYMQRWTDHWGELLPAQHFDRHLEDLVRRSDYLVEQVERRQERIEYAITTEDSIVETSFATIEGNAWVDVRELRLAGSSVPLDVEWVEARQWQAQVPLSVGANSIVVEAYNFQGNLIGSDSVTITTEVANPVADALEITELDYNPAQPTAEELAVNEQLTNEMFEFVELTNVTDSPVNLLGVHFSDGVEFTFPALILGPGESTLVVQNQAAFELRFGSDQPIAGEVVSGRFANDGERVAITDLYDTTFVDFTYDDQAPWPMTADGTGPSLSRASLQRPEGEADTWLAMAPTPGVFEIVGDFSMDGSVDEDDIQLMCQATHENNVAFDLNGDGTVNLDDLTALVQNVLGTSAGDAQLNGVFDSTDLVDVLQAGQYDDGIANNSTWTTGDWNCDGEFDSEDIVAAFTSGGYVADGAAAVHPIESTPTSIAVPRIHDRSLPEESAEEKTLELVSQANHHQQHRRLEQLAVDSIFGT